MRMSVKVQANKQTFLSLTHFKYNSHNPLYPKSVMIPSYPSVSSITTHAQCRSLKTQSLVDLRASLKTKCLVDLRTSFKTQCLVDLRTSLKTQSLVDLRASLKTQSLVDLLVHVEASSGLGAEDEFRIIFGQSASASRILIIICLGSVLHHLFLICAQGWLFADF